MSCRKVLHCSVVIVCINIEPRAPSFHCADKYNAMEAHAQPTCPFGCVPLSHTPLHSTWFSTATRCTPEMLCMAIKTSEREVLASRSTEWMSIPSNPTYWFRFSKAFYGNLKQTDKDRKKTDKYRQRCFSGVPEVF